MSRIETGLRRARNWIVRRCPGRADAGMTTAEYAVGTVAACGFAAVLYKVVTSSAVSHALSHLVTSAISVHP